MISAGGGSDIKRAPPYSRSLKLKKRRIDYER